MIGDNVLSEEIKTQVSLASNHTEVLGEHLYKEADQDKLKNNIPHVIDNPRNTCKQCEYWGSELNEDGICSNCIDENNEE